MGSDNARSQPVVGEMESRPEALAPAEYGALLANVRERIRSAQYEALRSVNRELVQLYWDIGQMIAERQRDESRGRSVVEGWRRISRQRFRV